MAVAHEIAAVKRSAAKCEKSVAEVIGTASIGDVVRQGDLYLVCVESVPVGAPAKSRQLAPGDTQGSRHVASGDCRVSTISDRAAIARDINSYVHGANVPAELIGPAVRCDGPATITHPEHGHKVLPADSTWVVVYQRAYADEVRRVQD